jgi:hypothetical protein
VGDGAIAASTIAEAANRPNLGVLNRSFVGRQAE